VLKEVRFEIGPAESHCAVKYFIRAQNCYFSGYTPESATTVNDADNIIRAIVEQERIDPFTFTFFDLWTSRGYRTIPKGKHDLKRLALSREREGIHVISWTPVVCPLFVLKAFGVPISFRVPI